MKYQNFRQRQPYGCGLYALANAIQDKSIVTDERIENSKNGNNIGQLNKWLIESGYDLFLDPLYFTCIGDRLPDDICSIVPIGDNVISLPVLIDLQYSDKGLMHMVAGEITVDGKLTVIDSLKDEEYTTTLKEFNEQYFRCFGLWHFRGITDGYILNRMK